MGGITYCGKRKDSAASIAIWILIYAVLLGILTWIIASVANAISSYGQMEWWNFFKILMDMTEGHRW